MADGPTNQASYLRALKAGMTLVKVLDLVRKFRKTDTKTPIVLMGSYNPIHAYGTARFMKDAAEAGIDGFLIVDLPPEEDEVLRAPARARHRHRALPRADHRRGAAEDHPRWRERLSLLCVDRRHHRHQELRGPMSAALADIQAATLPCTVGFGIRTPEQAATVARFADGAVVGTAIVSKIFENINAGAKRAALVSNVAEFCRALADSAHAARN